MSGMAAAQVLTQAKQPADQVLYPSAMNVDIAVPTWTWPRFAM
jgi:hypothetical protein